MLIFIILGVNLSIYSVEENAQEFEI
jgi:hypothetical protein